MFYLVAIIITYMISNANVQIYIFLLPLSFNAEFAALDLFEEGTLGRCDDGALPAIRILLPRLFITEHIIHLDLRKITWKIL